MTRDLTRLTWTDIRDLDKAEGVVILPIGAVEQHGPHLPTITDTVQVTRVLEQAFEKLPADVSAWSLPTLPYGKSVEHTNFPGTVSLSGPTLAAVVMDIAQSVSRAGFRRFALLNGHGGNVGVLDAASRDIRAQTGMMCFCIQPSYWLQNPFPVSDLEDRFGIHAGELETSLMLTLEPESVKMERAVAHFPKVPDGNVGLFGAVSAAWLTEDWSEAGVFGDATLGTAEKGEQLLEHAADRLATLITELSRFEMARG